MSRGVYDHKNTKTPIYTKSRNKKISKSKVGKPGHKHTDETKHKMSIVAINDKRKPSFKDRHHSDKTKNILRVIRKEKTEEKSSYWKGGITPENKKIRNSIEIRLWRESVFERDKFLCQMPGCNQTERYLNAHHIKKFSEYKDLRTIVSNGITLCKNCHNLTKGKELKYENLFIEIIETK